MSKVCRCSPNINRRLDPFRNRNRPYMATLPDQVNDGLLIFPLLNLHGPAVSMPADRQCSNQIVDGWSVSQAETEAGTETDPNTPSAIVAYYTVGNSFSRKLTADSNRGKETPCHLAFTSLDS
jgi:hypothetical protein